MVKVLNKNTTECEHCNSLLGFDESDLVAAIKCPECNQLIEVNRPLLILKDFGSLTWKEIISEFKSKGKNAFPTGATKEIALKNGEEYLVQIAHKGKSVIVGFRDLYGNDNNGGMPISDDSSFSDDYTKCSLRKWLNGDFFELLPDDFKEIIIPSKIKVGKKTIEDKVFIPSEFEIFGKKEYGDAEEGELFDLFKDWHNRIAGYSDGQYGRWYWLRTKATASADCFCGCYCHGGAGYGIAYGAFGVRPFFTIFEIE